ncbi:MAG TPA: hypothetical protein VGA22_14600 [Gemmatimonadales bacterium]|jgi:DNA anti-recombination protein RmuC
MPVTAKLSQAFYEQLGEQIANELVDWFNQVDATYRHDLRELNELNFARFDAKLEQRVVETHARIDRMDTKLNGRIDQMGTELNGRIDQMGTELNGRIDQMGTELNARIDQLGTELNARIDQLGASLRIEMANLEKRLEKRIGQMGQDFVRWSFVFWAAAMAAIVGLR